MYICMNTTRLQLIREAQHQDNLKKSKYYYEWARLRRDYPAIERKA